MARVLAVLSAICLVGAVALAMLQPPDEPLGQALYFIDHDLVGTLQRDVDHYLNSLVLGLLFVPLLLRPAWLLPAAIGVIFGGLAMTVSSRRAPGNQRRRS